MRINDVLQVKHSRQLYVVVVVILPAESLGDVHLVEGPDLHGPVFSSVKWAQ